MDASSVPPETPLPEDVAALKALARELLAEVARLRAENAALQARLSAVDIEIRRANSTVLLIKALGGDWQAAQ